MSIPSVTPDWLSQVANASGAPSTISVAVDEIIENFDFDARLDRDLQIQLNALQDQIGNPYEPRPGRGPEVAVALDAEWCKKPGNPNENHILSVQFALKGEGGEFRRIYYTDSGDRADRFRFGPLLANFLAEALEAGCILEWPKRVVGVGFLLRSDLAALDLPTFKNQIDAIGGAVASLEGDVQFELSEEDFAALLKNRRFTADDRGITRLLPVRFIDMARHVPVGTPLSAVGEMLGKPKIELPEGIIERMNLLLTLDKPLYERYALRDAEIALHYYLQLKATAFEWTGRDSLPPTSSSLATRLFLKTLKDAEIDFEAAFGERTIETSVWDSERSTIRTVKVSSPVEMRQIHRDFVSRCYHGGRNEAYYFGPTPEGVYFDLDLQKAYTTGLVDLRMVDFNSPILSCNPDDFRGHTLGFGLVRFQHPDSVKFPALPVTTEKNGLFFPLAGESYCTAPEIAVALDLGCQIEILHGVIFPWKAGDTRIFEPFVGRVGKLRKSYPKGSLQEQYAKLIGNGLYGKVAQGIKAKTVFDTRSMRSVGLGPSSISNEVMAAHVTGFIRAVLTEIINRVPAPHVVLSGTTDGFLTSAPLAEIDLSGPMARRFQSLCDRVNREA